MRASNTEGKEALPVNDGGTKFFVFSFRDQYLLECETSPLSRRALPVGGGHRSCRLDASTIHTVTGGADEWSTRLDRESTSKSEVDLHVENVGKCPKGTGTDV